MFEALVPVSPQELSGAPSLVVFPDLDDATVGLVDNGKPNTRELLLAMAEELQAVHPSMKVVGPFRTDRQFLASDELLDEIAARCDMVLNGLGDCGSCSSSSIHVAADLAERGIPAIPVCTQPFAVTAREIVARRGSPDLRFVLLEHPLSSLPEAELRERAREAIRQVSEIVASRAELAEAVGG